MNHIQHLPQPGGCCIFYTDYHDVDEEMRTIPLYGAHWGDTTAVGIARRELFNAPNYSNDAVASSSTQNAELYGSARCRRRRDDYFGSRW